SRKGHVFVFDLLRFDGRDMRGRHYSERYTELVPLVASLRRYFPKINIVNTFGSYNLVESNKRLLTSRAYEGFVFRRWNQSYFDPLGRKKLDIEDDYVVIGFNPGTNRLTGTLGSLEV